MSEPTVDRTRCPLCGGNNACAMEAGAGDCWCRDASFAPSLFERLPAGARGAACICRRCAEAAAPSPPPPR